MEGMTTRRIIFKEAKTGSLKVRDERTSYKMVKTNKTTQIPGPLIAGANNF